MVAEARRGGVEEKDFSGWWTGRESWLGSCAWDVLNLVRARIINMGVPASAPVVIDNHNDQPLPLFAFARHTSKVPSVIMTTTEKPASCFTGTCHMDSNYSLKTSDT